MAPSTQRGSPSRARVIARLSLLASVVIVPAALLLQCSRHGGSSSSPSSATFRAAAKELVKQRLRDPSSAEFTDIVVHEGGPTTSTIVCGRVNARNGFGGMTGAQRFVVGGTTALEDEIGAAAMNQMWAQFC